MGPDVSELMWQQLLRLSVELGVPPGAIEQILRLLEAHGWGDTKAAVEAQEARISQLQEEIIRANHTPGDPCIPSSHARIQQEAMRSTIRAMIERHKLELDELKLRRDE